MNGSKRQSHGEASSKARDRHIGCPLSWFSLVFPVVKGKHELAVALYVYRLRVVCGSRTVAVPNAFLTGLGIDRHAKYRALERLAAAGILTIKRHPRRTLVVTFRDRKRPRRPTAEGKKRPL
jgi:hypothetical protein